MRVHMPSDIQLTRHLHTVEEENRPRNRGRRAEKATLKEKKLNRPKRTLVELVLEEGSHGGAGNEERSNRSGELVALRVLEVEESGSKGATDASVRSHVLADPSGQPLDGGVGKASGREVFHDASQARIQGGLLEPRDFRKPYSIIPKIQFQMENSLLQPRYN